MAAALDHMAARVATDPFFLAYSLNEYARREGLDDAALAERLGCSAEALTLIRLCRAPRRVSDGIADSGEYALATADFREDIASVAGRFGCNAAALAAACRS